MATSHSTEARHSGLRPYLDVMRPRQWAKSVFVVAPLFFSGQLSDPYSVAAAVLAAVVFALVASAVYVINDLADVEADRLHPVKQQRPIASGQMSRQGAITWFVLLLASASAISIGFAFPPAVVGILVSYLLLNIAYSTKLRDVPLMDVAIIGAGFVLRVLAGAFAIDVEPSSWIILATGLLALLMAFGKRRADLGVEGADSRNSLHGYTKEFIDISVGVLAAAVIAFYALFTVSDYAIERFGSGYLHVTTFLVVIGILRYLQLVMVYEPEGSPTDIVWGDRPLQAVILAWLLAFSVLTYL